MTAEDRFAGATNVQLSEEGRRQAGKLAERLAGEKIAAVYASPLDRTMETARILSAPHGLEVQPREGLKEISHGRWEQHTRAEVDAMFPEEAAAWEEDPFTFAPVGGESGLQVTARSLPAIERWLFEPPQDARNGSLAVPVYFFGDLDHAGMQILASLREVFPQASAWRPGYVQLVSLLAAGAGHPPELAAKAQQTDPGRTGCAYADDELLPLLRSQGRFIDQEAFDLNNVDGQGR